MSQYRFGTFTSPAIAAAQTITLGFAPSSFKLTNYTGYGTATVVAEAQYYRGMAAGFALIKTVTATPAVASSILATNGFTAFSTGASYTATQLVMTGASKANPAVITSAAHGLATGDTITISAVVGMVQLNQNRYLVTAIDANTFSLRDLFGNAVDSTAYGTYISGGIINKISNVLVPPGNVVDNGSAGIILGTSLFRAAADVFYWEAFLDTPTGW